MNDRYLYRAKRTDNGEWVEGFYAVAVDRKGLKQHNILVADNDIGYFKWIVVDPSTICQRTGLKDKNGKMIWENDIMVGHIDDIFPEDATYVRVMWHNNGFCTHQDGYDDYGSLDEFDQNNFEVCGNTIDNPELLEVGE